MQLLRDVTQGVRLVRRNPFFSFVAMLTIALGVGTSTAIFSVVNAVLLRPLPYPDADRLVIVTSDMRARDVFDFPFAPADFHDIREQATLFESVGGVFTFRPTVTGDEGEPAQIRVAGVTPNLLSLLGARVVAGRSLEPEDATPPPQPPQGAAAPADQPPPPPTMVVLSHTFWQVRYGGADVIGKLIDIGGQRAQIVGVLAPGTELLFPPGINVERAPDVWAAMRIDYAGGSRINVFLRVIGKLKPGVTAVAAEQQLAGIIGRLREEFPIKKTADVHWRVEPMHEDLVADVRPGILALMGAVLFVLLIACANVANLLLVRAAARERELTVRAALGGGRARLLQQLLLENAVLAAGGALLGVLIAWGGTRLLVLAPPAGLPRLDDVRLDTTVLAFTVLLTFAAALLFGLLPAWRASRADVATALRESGRTAALARGQRLRSGVVVAEVALAFVLLVGSGLMVRSFAALNRTDPGFDPDGVLTFLAQSTGDDAQRTAFVQTLRERLAALPGVSDVTAATPLPLDGGLSNLRWGTPDAAADPARFQQATVHYVLPGYVAALRGRMVAGRELRAEDETAEPVRVVIDDVLARTAFGDRPAVGQRLLMRFRSNEPEPVDVVGVVAHQRHVALHGEPEDAVFIPAAMLFPGAASRWAVRVSGDPLSLANAVRATVKEIDPLVAVAEVQPMQALLDRAMAPTRFALVLISIFAGIAAFLAAIGLFGVLSTMVRQRTAEIGVRVAFGASAGQILALVLRQGMLLAVIGVVLGLAGALALTRSMQSLLVGISPSDPFTLAVSALGFIVTAAAACAIPAWRSVRLQPTVALREDG